MRKSGLFFLIALAIVLTALLSGCGGEKTADISQPVELIWYCDGDGTPKDLPQVEAKINEYLKPKINATLKLKFFGSEEYQTKMNTMAASGETVDILFTCSWLMDYRIYGPRGLLLPLDELLDKYGADIKKALPGYLWDVARVNGKLYAVPNYKDEVMQRAFLFNKNLLDKFGITIDGARTYAELEPIFAKVHAADPSITCYDNFSMATSPADKFDFIISDRIPGAFRLDDPSGKVVNQFEDKDYLEFFNTVRKYYKKGYIPKDGGPTAEFRSGRALCRSDVYMPGLSEIFTASFGFPCFAIPASKEPPVISTASSTGSMLGISATSKNPERAMMFLNLLNTDPVLQNLVRYGIENVHYKKVGGNTIHMLPESKNYKVAGFTMGNQFIAYTIDDLPSDYLEQLKKFNESGRKSPGLGFAFDTEPVKHELSAITNLDSEFLGRFYSGEADPEPIAKAYIQKCKNAGLDKVLAEMQKQVDEWKKSKK